MTLTLFFVASVLCVVAQTMDTMLISRVKQLFETLGKLLVKSLSSDIHLAALSALWAVGEATSPPVENLLTTKLKCAPRILFLGDAVRLTGVWLEMVLLDQP